MANSNDNRFLNSDYGRKSKVWVVVATHKAFPMPTDKMYIPLHVGAEGKVNEDGTPLDLGYQKDNTGDNISERNPQFCELTGLYWAWKNLNADYIGLVHYRRYFQGTAVMPEARTGVYNAVKGLDEKTDKWIASRFNNILTYKQLRPLLDKYKVIVPKKRHYYIETLHQHYEHNHYIKELDTAKEIMLEKYPEYKAAYDKAINRTWGYMFNMMILDKKLMDEYCEWLFDILFELSSRMENEASELGRELTGFENRFPGRVSERIFNVWLEHQLETGHIKPSEIKEIPFMYMEKINLLNKGVTFLRAKFTGKKPEKSF
ncbi:MAG: DUF4422 domain-containing protein [Eubacterium sp.]|nr:DUF4422 domain-containing protein [Eubacterium sp.]